jgi:hypothetical protein
MASCVWNTIFLCSRRWDQWFEIFGAFDDVTMFLVNSLIFRLIQSGGSGGKEKEVNILIDD